jgi:hypothetical protein
MSVQEKDESEHFSPYRADGKLVGRQGRRIKNTPSALTRYQVRIRMHRDRRNLFDRPRGYP